jgi:protein-disulfide isomerase
MSNGNAGGSLRRFYVVFAVVAAVGLGAVGYSVLGKARGSAVSVPVDLAGAVDGQELFEMAVPVTIGDEDAPATIIVFADYLCNHCSIFALQIKPLVEETFVATGQARLVYYDWPLNPTLGSFLAARAARCAGDQGQFWEYHRVLMRNQLTWGRLEDKIPTFEDYAEDLGIDRGEFRGCLNSDRHAQEITANMQLAQNLRLGGTPTILIGTGDGQSRRLPDYSFQTIQAVMEEILGG